jgi:hypothetical protein
MGDVSVCVYVHVPCCSMPIRVMLSLPLPPPTSTSLSLSPPPPRYIEARAEPPVDNSQDIVNATALFANGFTTMRFTRPLSASNSRDLSLTECRFFLYGWGGAANISTRDIGYHPSTPMVSRICLPTPEECGE